MKPQTDKLLWNAQETAKAISISARTLWTLTFSEKIPPEERVPHVRIGHRVLYDPADVRVWIERNKRGNCVNCVPSDLE